MAVQWILIGVALLITLFVLTKNRQKGNNQVEQQALEQSDDLYRVNPEGRFQVKFDADKIELIDTNGEHHQVLWQNLTRVAFKTTDQGPIEPDVYWLFFTDSEQPALCFPQGTIGDSDLLDYLPKVLDGIDFQQIINAMGSTDNVLFTIWAKPNSH